MDKSIQELIEWCRKESNRNAQMQGDKIHTARRRKTFRYRNHMLAAVANNLELETARKAEAAIKAISELPDKWRNYNYVEHVSVCGDCATELATELQALLKEQE